MIFGPFFNYFFIHFSTFSKTPPGGHFWRVQVPVYTQKCDFGAILGFRGGAKSTLGATISAKKAPKCTEFLKGRASGSRPGAIWYRKRPNMTEVSIFIDFGWILDQFLLEFS